jgi:hypothetical protein
MKAATMFEHLSHFRFCRNKLRAGAQASKFSFLLPENCLGEELQQQWDKTEASQTQGRACD